MRSAPEIIYLYKTLPLDPGNLSEQRLNALSADGWMLVATLPQLVFVRSIQRPAEVPIDGPLLLSIKQASEKLSISRTKLYENIHAGRLKTVRIGKSIRIPRQELEVFIRQHADLET